MSRAIVTQRADKTMESPPVPSTPWSPLSRLLMLRGWNTDDKLAIALHCPAVALALIVLGDPLLSKRKFHVFRRPNSWSKPKDKVQTKTVVGFIRKVNSFPPGAGGQIMRRVGFGFARHLI